MQGSLVLPRRFSQQSTGVLQSARSLTPELVGEIGVPLPRHCTCKLVGNTSRQEVPNRSIEFANDPNSVNEFCLSNRRKAPEVLSAEAIGSRRMKGNSLVSFSSCSYNRSLAPVLHPFVAIRGRTLDYSSWKSLASGLPVPFRYNPYKPWYSVPSRALPGLQTTHSTSTACKNAGQDFFIKVSDKYDGQLDFYGSGSEKGSISALSSSETSGNVKENVADEASTVFDEDTDTESEVDDEETNVKRKKEMRLKGMQEEKEVSGSHSDDEGEKQRMKTKSKVEVVGMSEDDSACDEEKKKKKKMKADEKELKKQSKKQKEKLGVAGMSEEGSDSESGSDSDEEKETKKKMKAGEKQLKKQAKKQKKEMKALKKLESESIEALDSEGGSELDEGEDDAIEVVSSVLDEDELEEDDFELVGDEELTVGELESEIEDIFEEYEDEELDDDFWEEEEGDAMVGDGGDGGGVVLGDTQWGGKALELAEVVVKELGTDFSIYAFKASPDGIVRVRLDKLSDHFFPTDVGHAKEVGRKNPQVVRLLARKNLLARRQLLERNKVNPLSPEYGSPTMTEIESFSRKYSATLDSSELIPDNVSVEVSSPGAERIVKIPNELERFKQLPMYVHYVEDETGSVQKDGVLELDSFDPASGMTVWKLANVKLNRERSGKGRPMNSKQRKWRAHVPLNSLKLVRLYLDV